MSDTIDVVINIEDISSQLNSARSQLVSFKKELSDMPDMSETFTEGLDRTIGAIELLQKKATEYDSSSSSSHRQTLASDQLSGLRDVNVSTQLFSQSGSFSVSLAKQMFGGLSAAAQVELNKSTAEIAAMIRSSLGSLRSKSVTGMARDLLLSPDAQRIYQSRMSHVTERQYEQYIEAQLPHVAPMHQLGEYQVARHGRHSQATITPSLQTVIPNSYLASYKAKAYQGSQLSHDQQNQYMQQDQRELLRNEIMQNDAAARAARSVPGLMQRSRDNHPMLAKNITRQQFEAYRRNLWNDYVARASGRESSRIDIFDPGLPDEERRRAYARMNGASAGQVLKAMRATEGLVVDDAWGAAEVRGKFERLPREARRSQEQYEVAKYTFDGIAAKANPSRVMISESPNTRLLGMSGRHNQFSDMVAVVSLSGYDKSDAAHRAQLEHLLSGSPVSLPGSNKQYIAQNMHGTGEDAVLRMVEAEAYRTVMQREHQWLKDNGLISQDGSTGMSGTNYWNNFIRENMDFGSIQGLRRHYDATGKGWTPGHDIEANLQNRKFAMVDFSRISGDKRQRFADGLAWLGKDILPQGSIQGRFAVAGKGTLHQLNHKTLGDWARSVGLIGVEERFILPGIHGDVDLTDMHGMFDVSQIKNLPAYEHFSTSDAANDAFTKMIRRYGISSMTTYNDSETRSKGIGAQAMMFMKLPQSMQDAQAQEYQRRINALMTETGIRTFILGGEDNPIRAQLEAGEIDITNPQITSMVEKEKESLQRRMIAGEWIDFSDSGQVTNQKINKTPITSLFEQAGLSRAEQIAQLRARMQSKGFTEDYSDDDIAGIWGLGGVQDGAIVDFTRPDAELVAINRSPNGFGQFVYGRNYANQARAIYEAFGITPQGVYVSEEDMFRLGDADYDGDGAKTVYGDLAIAMRDTAVLHEQLRGSVKNVGQARERTLDYGDQIQGFSDIAVQRRLAIESSLAAAAAMGLTSGAGEKAAQFDLSNERNRKMLAAAIQAERAYSIATAGFKNASEVELTPEMLATNVLGRKWQFQPTKFSRLFNTTGQDGLDIPNAEDIFMATVDGKQIPVNMAELRKLNIDRTNLPSINQDSVVMGIRAASAMGPQGDSIQQMLAVEQALDQGIGYGNLGEASIRLLHNMRAMKLQTNAGLRGISTQEEAVLLEQQIAEARREINAQADSLAAGNSGKVRSADGTEMSRGAFVAAAARAANIDIAENHLHQFGMTQASVRERFGDDAEQAVEQMQPKYGIVLPTKATEPDSIKRRPPIPETPEATQPKDRSPASDIKKESTPHARESATPAPMPSSPPPQAFCPKCGASYNAALGSCPNCSNSSPVQPARSLREFLSRIRSDMTEIGLPQDEAAKLITQWYNQNVPSEQDPIMMDDATSAKILEKYLQDETIDSIYDYAMGAHAGDAPGVPRDKDILMSDLETFRQVEGSRAVYEDMMSAMRQTSSKWYGMAANQDENPEYGFYSKAMHQLKNTRLRFDNALQNGDASMFGADTALGTDLRNQLGLMEENYFAATRAHMSKSGDNAFEALRSSVAGTGDEFDKQLAKLESWSKSVEKLEQQLLAFKKAREEMPADSNADTEADRKVIEDQETRIEEAKRLAAQGRVDLLKDNNESFAAKFESLSESMTGKTASPQEKIRRTVEQYKKQIAKYQEQLGEAFAKNLLTEEDYNARKAQQAGLSTYASEGLERELQARYEAQEAFQLARTQRQESSLRRRANQLARDPYGTRRNSLWGRATMERDGRIDQYDNLISSYEETIAQKKNKLMTMDHSSEGYANASAEVKKLEKELSKAQAAASKLENTGSTMGFVFAEIGQRVGQVASQFGRQMFQKAIQEAKRFVQEYDAAMTEIQMVTMKTDAEISQLGSGLIQTAIDMKVSVSDVTSAATNLYRQGLSDEEVDVRMEDVLKFAKVAGIKAEEASKIITTALSNNLVESSSEAMDALVSQGDAAATSAEEIAKGMKKSAASAKQAGVSYEQLVTMLTIITSKTQLGGNQAGTALQTLMYRLYRVNEGEDFYDENGNRIAANEAAKALDELGVSIYGDNGAPRGAYDIMVDIAKNWDSASNISQEMVLNALGAGRQRTNIATLIQGLAEDDGALAERYMSLAEGSEGITDTKYIAYLESLGAALTTVKSSFDQLVAAFNLGDTATDFLDFISEMIQGIAAVEEATGLLSATITALGLALAGTAIVAHPWLALGTLAVGGALWGYSKYGQSISADKAPTADEIAADSTEAVTRYNSISEYISESESILSKAAIEGVELTDLEIDTVQETLDLLAKEFGIATTEFTGAAGDVATASALIRQANDMMQAEFEANVQRTQQEAATWAEQNVLEGHISPVAAEQQMYRMLYSKSQTPQEAVATYVLSSYSLPVSATPPDQSDEDTTSTYIKSFGKQLTQNQYLNGTKPIDEYSWVNSSSSERGQHEQAMVFQSLLQLVAGQGFKDIVLEKGIASENELKTAFGSLPLSYENMLTIATTSYNDLADLEHVNNSQIWKTTFGVENGETYYNQAQAFLHRLLFFVMKDEQQDFSDVIDSNEQNLRAKTRLMFDSQVYPYIDRESGAAMEAYFIDQAISQGYLDKEKSDDESFAIFKNQQEELLESMWLNDHIDVDGWMSRFMTSENAHEYMPYYSVVSEDGTVLRSGLTKQAAFDELRSYGFEIPATADDVDMGDWLAQNPDPASTAEDAAIYSYTDLAGNVHSKITMDEAKRLQEEDRKNGRVVSYVFDGESFSSSDDANAAKILKINQSTNDQNRLNDDIAWAQHQLDAVKQFESSYSQQQRQLKDFQDAYEYATSYEQALQIVKTKLPAEQQDEATDKISQAQEYYTQRQNDFIVETDENGTITGFKEGYGYLDQLKIVELASVDNISKASQDGVLPNDATIDYVIKEYGTTDKFSNEELLALQYLQNQYAPSLFESEQYGLIELAQSFPELYSSYVPADQSYINKMMNDIESQISEGADQYKTRDWANQVRANRSFLAGITEERINRLENEPVEIITQDPYVNEIVKYISYADWQAQYAKETVNRYNDLFGNNDAIEKQLAAGGYYLKYSPPETEPYVTPEESAVEFWNEALSGGQAVYETDEVKHKRNVDNFARLLSMHGVDSMQEFTDFLSTEKYGDLKALFQSIGDGKLAKIVDNAISGTDENGRPIIDEDLADTAWQEAWSLIMSESGSYSDAISSNRFTNAYYLEALKKSYDSGYRLTEDQYAALSAVYGESLVGKMQQQSLDWYDTSYNEGEVANGNFVVEDGKLKATSASMQQWYAGLEDEQAASWEDYQNYAQRHNFESMGKLFSNDEQRYWDALTANMKYGISGLTTRQSLEGAYSIMSAVSSGGINNYLLNDEGMQNAYTSQFASMNDYITMAQMLEDQKVLKRAEDGTIAVDENGQQTTETYTLDDLATLDEGSAGYEAIDAALKLLGKSAEEAKDIIESLNAEIAAAEASYSDMTEEILQNSKALKGNKREAASAHKTLNQTLTDVSNRQYYRQQYLSGARDDETIASIVSQTGFDEDYVKEHTDQVADMLDKMMESDREEVQAQVSAFDQYLDGTEFSAVLPDIVASGGDLSAFAESISAYQSDAAAELQSLAAALSGMGITAHIVAVDAGGATRYQIKVDNLTGLAGRKTSSGGGGGGGKSAAEKLIEEQEREYKIWEHRRKMIQYEETRYQNAGELSNYSIMLGHESDEIQRQIKLREQQLEELKKQMAATKEHSDDWYTLRDAIMSCEEALSELNNDYEELERTQEEVEQQILKLHTDLEGVVLGEIEARIQKERDMQDATVSMQDIILDAIRERYRKEWELMQEDINKKRQALEEEMAQIDERLQRRKNAEDEAAKYEELAELERQQAQVSMDSTRTKDQAELREKIASIKDELAWSAAEDEAALQKDELQDQLDAYDAYENEYQEYLDDYLEDANNFADEVNEQLSGTQEELFGWLQENVEAYALSLSEQQEQMLRDWKDTYDEMKGIVATYWAEITQLLSGKESFLAYQMESDTYKYASEDEQKQLLYEWETMYDDWMAAQKISDEAVDYEHDDDFETETGGNSSGSGGSGSGGSGSGSGGSGNSGSGNILLNAFDSFKQIVGNIGNGILDFASNQFPSRPAINVLPNRNVQNILKYADGGLVDYTGLAWVDGTASKPEAFLSAADTDLVRTLIDTWQYVINSPVMSNVDGALNHGQSNNTFGDINIAITEASFADDADYEEVARRVGDVFTKELSKQGFRTATFNF